MRNRTAGSPSVGSSRGMTGIHSCGVWACVAAALAFGSPVARCEIPWRNTDAGGIAQASTDLTATVGQLAARANRRHVVVRFHAPVDAATRKQLKRTGVALLRYLGDNAYFACFSGNGAVDAAAVAATPSLANMQPIQRTWKLDPKISAGIVPHWVVAVPNPVQGDIVGVYVLFHADVSLNVEAVNAVARHGAVIRDELESINGLVIELPLANVEALADEDVVQWIEWPLPRMSESNNSNSVITEADQVQAAPYNLDGTGVTVLVYDGGTARSTHVDFQGRLTTHDGSGLADHATHVAGTIGGAGVANASFEGMAPGTTLLSYGFQFDGSGIFLYSNPGDLESDYNQAINVFGADLANNSIGTNTETNGFPCAIQGDYGVTAALIDAIVGGSLGAPFRILWANGNERQGTICNVEGFGDYYSTAPPSGAKNHITIGALNSNNDSMTSFSSWGPVDDGRIKPDVSGPGCQSNGDFGVTSCSSSGDTAYAVKCGTSMATPTATGLAALLLEDFRVQFPSQPDFRNSTLKALLVHNAQDILNTGPDYQSGYGSLRIRQTVDFMRTGNFLEDQVSQGGTFSVLVSVDPGDPELKVTLAWDDVPGTPNVNPALVNDLDLRVFDPSSTQFFPWTLNPLNPSAPAIQTQADHVNNIEQVVVNTPSAGTWRIEVSGFNVPSGPQSFSLCASPLLVACSSQGTMALDAAQYGCESTVGAQVIDCDLNTDNFAVEAVTVTIASTSEPGGETVLLTETGADTADFRGSIVLSTTNSAGVLLVGHGDSVTATYVDANDGQGGVNLTRTDTAGVNCVGPVISNVQTTGVGSDTATVTFNTNTAATGTVRYGTSCGALTNSQSEAGPTTSHTVALTGLNSGTVFFYAVDAVDEQGNPATDDNFGACYSFTTLTVAFDFPMDVDPGWTLQGDWAFGQPTGGGGQHGGPDPTSAFSGNNVYGYNLNGDYPNNLPERHLTSTALDCTGLTNVKLRFWRWLGVEQPAFDHAYVRVSNNGSTWTTLWENAVEVADTSWVFQEFDISAIADDQPTVFLRWTIGTTDSSWQYCGWNLDDIQIIGTNTVTATCSDGVLNQGETRIDCGGPCPACACTTDGACDNTLFCDGVETCDGFGICQIGTAPNCNDGVGCTDDACNETANACDHVANDANCDNGLFCDGAETCDAALDCQTGSPPVIDDGVACTDDSCDEVLDVVVHTANDANCDNGLFCDGAETCDAALDCQTGSPPVIDDGVACTDDSCDEVLDVVVHAPNDANCDNGLFCDGAETCDAALDCQTGSPPVIDDGVACTDDSCDEVLDAVVHAPNDANCDNGLFCDGAETCDAALDCQTGSPPVIDDGVACTDDSCDEVLDVVVHAPNDANCDNGLFCDGSETCDAVLDCQANAAPCATSCEHCVEASTSCGLCIFDLDNSGVMGTGDFSLFTACFGDCYAPGDPCLASDFDQTDDCVGTGDYAAFLGCFGLACADCPTCAGPGAAPGGGAGGGSVDGVAGGGSAVAEAVSIRLVLTDQPAPSDYADSLRQSMRSTTVDRAMFVEVWANPDVPVQALGGLAAVYMDVAVDSDLLIVDEIMHSALFETLASGVSDDATGEVTSLGGCAALGEASLGLTSDWVRVATLRMHATRLGLATVKAGPAARPYGVAMFGTFGDVDPSLMEFGEVLIKVQRADVARRGLRKSPAQLRP